MKKRIILFAFLTLICINVVIIKTTFSREPIVVPTIIPTAVPTPGNNAVTKPDINILEDFSFTPNMADTLSMPQAGRFVKILLYKDLDEVFITSNGTFKLFYTLSDEDKEFILTSGKIVSIKAPLEGTINSVLSGPIEIKPDRGDKILNIITVNKDRIYSEKRYRGKVEILINSKGKVNVINELTINEYLAGVIPNEMPSSFPLEALKAQAIAARTYTIKHLGGHKEDGADLCSTVHCQCYGGVDGETEITSRAVRESTHQMVFYQNTLADTVYNSTCGGITANVENCWSSSVPTDYLKVTGDQCEGNITSFNNEDEFKNFINNPPPCYCQESGKFRWTRTITADELEKALSISLPVIFGNKDLKITGLTDISVEQRSSDGRVTVLLIKTKDGDYRVEKDKIRWITSGGKVGRDGLSSTLFYIEKPDDKTFSFAGGGWGHGIGLCQYGAKGLAEHGYKAEDIILHYYPGCIIGSPLWYHKNFFMKRILKFKFNM